MWRSFRRGPPFPLPRSLRPWLLDRGSLTKLLLAASGNRFSVRILHQRIAVPRDSERRALALACRRLALIREVILYGADQPWVYARSILPLASLTGRLRRWRKLDERPLGERLFDIPHLGRGPIEIAHLNAGTPALAAIPADAIASRLWGRRSVFFVYRKPLLVNEIFLAPFPLCQQLCGHSLLSTSDHADHAPDTTAKLNESNCT